MTTAPTIAQLRAAKRRVAELLRGRPGLAGVGIGQHDGEFVIRVNWQDLPSDIDQLGRIGSVTITHCRVGVVKSQ